MSPIRRRAPMPARRPRPRHRRGRSTGPADRGLRSRREPVGTGNVRRRPAGPAATPVACWPDRPRPSIERPATGRRRSTAGPESSFGPVSRVVTVSIRTPSSRVDLALPDRTTIAEVLETVLDVAPRSLREQALAHGGWILRTAAGRPLPGSTTLLDEGITGGTHAVPGRGRHRRDLRWSTTTSPMRSPTRCGRTARRGRPAPGGRSRSAPRAAFGDSCRARGAGPRAALDGAGTWCWRRSPLACRRRRRSWPGAVGDGGLALTIGLVSVVVGRCGGRHGGRRIRPR